MLLIEMPHIRNELLVRNSNCLQKPNFIGEPLGSGFGGSSPRVTTSRFDHPLNRRKAGLKSDPPIFLLVRGFHHVVSILYHQTLNLKAQWPQRQSGASGYEVCARMGYIIVGTGSSGCALASRSSEDPATSVLRLESGPVDKNPFHHIPAGYAVLGDRTLKMEVDETVVVTPDLRIHGVESLRVCDTSIMLEIISGNTDAPTIMIAEKAADLIWGRSRLPATATIALTELEISPQPVPSS
jgi:GMC oxidoreductase